MRRAAPWFVLALLSLLVPGRAEAQRKLKVFISADMEGIAGVVTGDQLGPGGFEYDRFRGFMTGEVLAAIDGAKAAGATDIVVADSHGNGESLLIDKFPADVRIVRAWPRPLGMMEGIDSTFDAAIFIGYHASSVNPTGVRAHTISSANITRIALNGTDMPEGGINAAIAGHFGVPVVLVSGDDAAVAEIQKLIGPVEGAVVKRAISFHSAETMTPEAAQALIREKTRTALSRRASLEPYVLQRPVRLDLALKSYRPAELLAYLPGVTRTGSRSIAMTAPTVLDASKFLEFVTNYNLELQP